MSFQKAEVNTTLSALSIGAVHSGTNSLSCWRTSTHLEAISWIALSENLRSTNHTGIYCRLQTPLCDSPEASLPTNPRRPLMTSFTAYGILALTSLNSFWIFKISPVRNIMFSLKELSTCRLTTESLSWVLIKPLPSLPFSCRMWDRWPHLRKMESSFQWPLSYRICLLSVTACILSHF